MDTRKESLTRILFSMLWQMPLLSVPFALFFGTLFGADWHSYVITYEMSLVFGFCINTSILVTRRYLAPRWFGRLKEPREKLGWTIGVCILGASFVGSYAAAFIIHYTILPGFMGGVRAVVISGMFTLLFAGLFAGINYAIVFYRQSVERARQVEQIRAELAEAELRALRAQINPHFLFNTLNTIAALIAINPAAAEDTTTRLADVFRYALRSSERDHARFADELDFLRAYLEIERTRFGDRLRIEEAIEPGLDSIMIPSLLLQPLVENAIQHGISTRPDGGHVRISARREGDRLAIEIADDGPGFDGNETPSGNGFGLHSVRERLRAAGHADGFQIDSSPGRGTRVRITLPAIAANPSTSDKGPSS